MGWKDILRPIRDGLRDNLPSTRPREDEDKARQRRKQRAEDSERGFAYLDSFEELQNWNPDEVDPLHRANTPLLRRPAASAECEQQKARVVLIHDFSGNYHPYEACQGCPVQNESYACLYMQFIDSFVYFSHKLVCIPPPTWVNALHRNGVRVLGTFLVEPQSPDIGSILKRGPWSEHSEHLHYPVAQQLTTMARHYGFDGWLLNIEKTFALGDWSRDRLEGFISQLRRALGSGSVIWYDSLSIHNTLQYQNSLTQMNLPFAKAAGTLLTNYVWTPEKAEAAKHLGQEEGLSPDNIVFGIDVWAQNSHVQGNKRKTWGGGGTHTGIAVAELAGRGLAAGIFAPAWPYEHFGVHARSVERSMWDGDQLPSPLVCDCQPSAERHTMGYMQHPITSSARQYPAGSNMFFYTNFEQPFTPKDSLDPANDTESCLAHIGRQSVLPRLPARSSTKPGPNVRSGRAIVGELMHQPARLAISLEEVPSVSAPHVHVRSSRASFWTMKLFDLDMTGPLDVTLVYRKAETPKNMEIKIVLLGRHESGIIPTEACADTRITIFLDWCNTKAKASEANRLTGIGVSVSDDSPIGGGCTLLLEVLEICIKPRSCVRPLCQIDKLALCRQSQRLSWEFVIRASDVRGRNGPEASAIPCSDVTGPFSHFRILANGKDIGVAHALEYMLPANMTEEIDGQELFLNVVGIGFDGDRLCTARRSLRSLRSQGFQGDNEDWQMINSTDARRSVVGT